MKQRQGFVANSSSTSFFFGVPSGATLSEKILKYKDHFNLSMETWDKNEYSINALDVVDAIESLNIEPLDIEEHIKEVNKYTEQYKEWIKEDYARKGRSFWAEYVIQARDHIKKMKKAQRFGMKVYRIGFGDNHGNISGGDVGNCMDYEGRYIDINRGDFIVFTKQNR